MNGTTPSRWTRIGRTVAALWILVLSVLTPVRTVYAESMATPEIVALTTAGLPACLNWSLRGICVWMTCVLGICWFNFSIKVGHQNPDAVVGVFNGVGENPWTEMGATLGVVEMAAVNALVASVTGFLAGGGLDRAEDSPDRVHTNLRFRETDVIGHPLSAASLIPGVQAFVSGGLLCPSETLPLVPYFTSAADSIGWRLGIPDMLLPPAWIPGLREIGHFPLNTWGGVYPRSGFVNQSDEAKGAAVLAQRAGDIVTRIFQPHVYLPILHPGFSGGYKIWSPGELVEGDASTGTWQMLLPVPEASCGVFGENDILSINSWGGGKQAWEGDFMWNLWRPYECCLKAGATYVGTIGL